MNRTKAYRFGISAVFVIAAALFAAPANGLEWTSEVPSDTDDGYSFLVPSPPAAPVTGLRYDEVGPLSDEEKRAADVRHRFIQMSLDHPDLRIASTALDPKSGEITVYSAADADFVRATLVEYGLDAYYEYAQAARSAEELNGIVHDLIGLIANEGVGAV